ncbi:MAG: DUF268 domain-containing protein [Pseudomonadota bacterium]|jgi:SAM-dependent methyltransferase
MREAFKKIYWLLCVQLGFDIRRLIRSLRGLPRYVAGWFQFRKEYKGQLDLLPCLYDWYEEGGATKNEYFWQDLYVARKIYIANPEKHVDIGSRIDGFVAHVASFREIEVFDIRPITSLIPGVLFRQADLMNPTELLIEYCDSLSCLHALEHFGLGRYGDPIDSHGYAAGLGNMAGILRPGGLFYLSVPIGRERVEFNAHRIFDPLSLVRLAAANGLLLREFAWIGSSRTLVQSASPEQDMNELSKLHYALGIFTFVKQ